MVIRLSVGDFAVCFEIMERQSGYSCVCFARHSQFTDNLLHIWVTLGAVRCLQTHDLCGTVIPQGTFSCPSGNSPCAAPSVDLTACVAVIYPPLRICGYMDAQSTSCGRKNPLPFPHSLSSEQPPCPLRKGVIHKRVETLVSTLLCACRVGKIPLASQATIPR